MFFFFFYAKLLWIVSLHRARINFPHHLHGLSLHHVQVPAVAQNQGLSPRSALCHLVAVFILHYDSENSDTPVFFNPRWIFLTYEVVTLCDSMTLGYCFNTCRGLTKGRRGWGKIHQEEWSIVLTTWSFYCLRVRLWVAMFAYRTEYLVFNMNVFVLWTAMWQTHIC